ncbi:TPA: AvrD family protein [Serratia fonticola]
MSSIQTFSSIDEILGPSENRFFSSGYRRSEHHISNLVLRANTEEKQHCLEAVVSLSYPRDWSVKNIGMDVTPHLSTIDMLVIAIQMIETHLTCCFDLSQTELQKIHIGEIAIHAGTKPQENLNDIPITATLRRSEPKHNDPYRFISTYECRVGLMRAVCQVEHPPSGSKKPKELRYRSIDDAVENMQNRYYTTGYKKQKHILSNIILDLTNLTANADVEVLANGDDAYITLPQAASYIDVFVTCAQLAQTLLYSLDGLTRNETSTLWMIRSHFSEGSESVNHEMKSKAFISESKIIELNGRKWRNANIIGTLGNKDVRVTFAHALPSAFY